ncbi:MAG: hypothetical protein UU14_C0040G0013 [Candidatus Roizmanbacteria bacterium GW2011_GWB1_40_7]|uniref:Uncharacterized protein n=1 Tax=Candidatus Roizmanbacteria bacterium GW2011_GWB1_40_7 TaxID=1618482 RepID=A0A0G0T1M3_9BACT|nr:MAG: hypothetical protein UU14_C0040G0013 [Candidatus Roizmanbacteria bacterium GW2011_GWB1_40_7]
MIPAKRRCKKTLRQNTARKRNMFHERGALEKLYGKPKSPAPIMTPIKIPNPSRVFIISLLFSPFGQVRLLSQQGLSDPNHR